MGYHYVIMYQGEKVRSCDTYEDAQRALKFIHGGTIVSLMECKGLPRTKMPKLNLNNVDLRYKKYKEVS